MKRVVIVGAGFARLAAAKALRHADEEVLVIDRVNHNSLCSIRWQHRKDQSFQCTPLLGLVYIIGARNGTPILVLL
jgi:hypothetical protein